MTAKEKALELSVKFHDHIRVELMEEGEVDYYGILAKQCALIAVEEILNANPTVVFEEIVEHYGYKLSMIANEQYWKEVKQQIEEL